MWAVVSVISHIHLAIKWSCLALPGQILIVSQVTDGLHQQLSETLFILFHLYLNREGQLRRSSHLQLQPDQDKAKQCDTNTELVVN
jgi:hypothetical protein